MNIEEIVIDSLHESIPGTNFTKHATIDFINPTINQFESFKKEIQQRLGVDITELNFPYWETVSDMIEDIEKEIKHER
ncbi:hypothetical protein [Sulfurimonas sp.]|uniref:hypothetical protein n=1 Tax=Sulfurimonas sp. TaxID=2022749 RepID=UPI003D0C4CFA